MKIKCPSCGHDLTTFIKWWQLPERVRICSQCGKRYRMRRTGILSFKKFAVWLLIVILLILVFDFLISSLWLLTILLLLALDYLLDYKYFKIKEVPSEKPGRTARRKVLAIVSTPFIFIFSILLILPLVVVLILTFHFHYAGFLIFAVITGVFLIFWSILRSQDKGFHINAGRRLAITAVSILAFSLIVHAIANIAVSRSLQRTMARAEAEGILLMPEEVIPPPVPDEDNAALVYEEAFDLFEKLKNKYQEEWKYMPYESIRVAELTEAQKADITRIMQEPEFKRFFTLIEKAVNMPDCRFDMGLENYPLIVMSHFSKMRSMARFCAARIYILTEAGRYDEAVEFAKTFLRLGGAQEDEPIRISYMTRIAIEAIAVNSMERLLNNPEVVVSSEDYYELISIIEEKNISVTPVLLGDFTLDTNWITGQKTNYRWLKPYSGWFSLRINPEILDIILSKPFIYLYDGYLGSPIFKDDYNFYLASAMAIITD